MLFALNCLSVFIYGILTMTFFLDVRFTKKNMITLWIYTIFGALTALYLYYAFGNEILQKVYPLAIHLPVILFFHYYYKKPVNQIIFVLCTTYILTTPRRWLGDSIAIVFNNKPYINEIVQIIATIPLLIIFYKYVRPFFIKIIAYSNSKIRFLVIIPLVYYVIAYITTVYTNLLYSSEVVLFGILTIGLVGAFIYFLIVYFNELIRSYEIKNERNILSVQISALQTRYETIKQSEINARIYRHDLRHHLQVINNYLLSSNVKEAQRYIFEIEKNIYDNVTVTYCENEAVNLILSSYAGMAQQRNIPMEFQIHIPKSSRIPDVDFCIILANAVENAINACTSIIVPKDRFISISCKHKNNKFMIQIENSYTGELTYENDIPIASTVNHGFGTKSIVTIVNKHNGIYSFNSVNGIFKLNIIL